MDKLDDGERWIPSDIFPADDDHHHIRPFASNGSSIDDVSRQLRILDLFDRPPRATSYIERLGEFGPRAQYAVTTATYPNGCYGLIVGPTIDQVLFNLGQTGPRFYVPYTPVVAVNIGQSVYLQVDGPRLETRIDWTSRPVQRQQNRALNNHFAFQANGSTGFGSSLTSSRGSTSGTGVFIPHAPLGTPPVAKKKDEPSGETTAKTSPKTRKKGKARKNNTSAEDCLPKDWTY